MSGDGLGVHSGCGFVSSLPGLESQVVRELGLGVQQRLLVALAADQLALSQAQTPLLDVDGHWVRQVALHDEQRTENHLKHEKQSSDKQMLNSTGQKVVRSIRTKTSTEPGSPTDPHEQSLGPPLTLMNRARVPH